MNKKFYVFTVSRHQNIISMFENTREAGDGVNTFLGARFDTKDDCLDFAQQVELKKSEVNETNFSIHCTCDGSWNPFVGFKS